MEVLLKKISQSFRFRRLLFKKFKSTDSLISSSIQLDRIKDVTTLDKIEISNLKTKLKDSGVLIIPSHRLLSDNEQLKFTNRLGVCSKKISYVTSNLNSASIDTTTKKTYLFSPLWHIDSSYLDCPPHLSIMQMVKKSPSDWETSFVSLNEIYKHISTEIKTRWRTLNVMYSKTDCIHPLLWIHPFTGKPIVFFDFRFVSDIFDLCAYTGKVVLENMNNVIINLGNLFEKAKPICKHNWQLGDIVIIDNYAVSKKENFKNDREGPGLLRRTTTKGIYF